MSEVTKWLMLLSKSDWAKSFESLGIIARGDNFSNSTLFAIKIILANSPVLSASLRLNGKIWTFFKGKSSSFPKTQYSAILMVENLRQHHFLRNI
jgi:hypothetical protein